MGYFELTEAVAANKKEGLRLRGRFRLTRGAQFFRRAAFVFHRTFKERWIANVATGR
jgi:hypothetical protein